MNVIINYWAVLAAAVGAMVVGSIWYAPPVLGKIWMQLSGIKPDPSKKNDMFKLMAMTFVCELIMAYILAHFVAYTGGVDARGGLQAAAWIWLGFVATTVVIQGLYTNKSWKLLVLDSGHYLLVLLVMGAILGAWR